MLGLVLQGGGARGAFQAGVIQALLESGYRFDAVSGTSIGALNGAMLAQGDFDKCINLWRSVEVSSLVDFDDDQAKKIANKKMDASTFKYVFKSVGRAITGKGVSSDKIRQLVDEYVDETKLRASDIDFGLVTYDLTEFKPIKLFKEDIPRGKLAKFIFASANFPILQQLKINRHIYVDGGIYDNFPIKMMVERGYKDVIAITTKKTSLKVKDGRVDIINPSEKPGLMVNFTSENIHRGLKMGYLDGMKFVHGYKGEKLYITELDYDVFERELLEMPATFFESANKVLGIEFISSKTLNLTVIVSKIAKLTAIKKYDNLGEVFLKLAEKIALSDSEFDRFRVITFHGLLSELRSRKPTGKLEKQNEILDIFLEHYI